MENPGCIDYVSDLYEHSLNMIFQPATPDDTEECIPMHHWYFRYNYQVFYHMFEKQNLIHVQPAMKYGHC